MDLVALLRLLSRFQVRFVVVGGVAAVLHGSSRVTQDLDIVYDRRSDNLSRLAEALASVSPYPRGAPLGLPFRWDSKTLEIGLNFTLQTELGALDLLGEIAGCGGYDAVIGQSLEIEIFGIHCMFLGLNALIRAKRAAGRPKDLEAIAELETIMEETSKKKPEDA